MLYRDFISFTSLIHINTNTYSRFMQMLKISVCFVLNVCEIGLVFHRLDCLWAFFVQFCYLSSFNFVKWLGWISIFFYVQQQLYMILPIIPSVISICCRLGEQTLNSNFKFLCGYWCIFRFSVFMGHFKNYSHPFHLVL